ncbi:MAG: very short patch repair endonuclease [Bryobacter sp.]|nr:very short patch repair endonuclease [Bryobacter sp.]
MSGFYNKGILDNLSQVQRSRQMSLVRPRDTKPEWIVRRTVHSLGYRYRLHVAYLPGKPDLVFPSRQKIIFVHGCFWHRHRTSCPLTRIPKSRVSFWEEKFVENRKRDRQNLRELRKLGWQVLTLWECELNNPSKLVDKLKRFLDEQHDIN